MENETHETTVKATATAAEPELTREMVDAMSPDEQSTACRAMLAKLVEETESETDALRLMDELGAGLSGLLDMTLTGGFTKYGYASGIYPMLIVADRLRALLNGDDDPELHERLVHSAAQAHAATATNNMKAAWGDHDVERGLAWARILRDNMVENNAKSSAVEVIDQTIEAYAAAQSLMATLGGLRK